MIPRFANKPDMIWVSTQDWDDVWTRKQRFAQLFARSGHRVLYIESQLHWLGYLRSKKRWRTDRAWRFLKKPRSVESNLYIATPPLLFPGQMMSIVINKVNKYFLILQIAYLVKSYGFHDPLLWLYPPDSVELVGKLGESRVVFDCVDDWSQFKGLVTHKTVESYTQRLFLRSDLVLVTHENLYRQAQGLASNVHLVPNGVEPEHFEKAQDPETMIPGDVGSLPKPVVGFIGSIQYWLDFELIEYLASKRPAWSFVFIGGVYVNVGQLVNLPNVHFLGLRRYETLPAYLKGFDVCINPFKMNDLANSVDPLKVYEYLAAGKPVVSVDMPAMGRFGDVVTIVRDKDSFLSALDKTLSSKPNESAIRARIECARMHSWARRFEQINAVLLNPSVRSEA